MSEQGNRWQRWSPVLLLAAFLPLKIAVLVWAHYQGEQTFVMTWILGFQGGSYLLVSIAIWWALDSKSCEHLPKKWVWLMVLVYFSIDVIAPVWEKTHLRNIKRMELQPVEVPQSSPEPR
jgi:hypothetical protein